MNDSMQGAPVERRIVCPIVMQRNVLCANLSKSFENAEQIDFTIIFLMPIFNRFQTPMDNLRL